MSHVEVRAVSKSYGVTPVLDEVTFDVAAGEMVCLLGPSGCGKTTTLRGIGGFIGIDSGEIWVGGRLQSSGKHTVPPERRNTGFIFQSYAIWPHMSVYEHVTFGLTIKGLPRSEVAAKAEQVLEFVGLQGLENRNATQLSGGQQQRLAIARSIVVEPSVLLFDEPLSNLDAKLRERMRVELAALQDHLGITSIYVTHDQVEAMTIADRIILMDRGKVVEAGPPRQLFYQPNTEFGARFMGAANVWPAVMLDRHEGERVRAFELASGEVVFAEAGPSQSSRNALIMLRPTMISVEVTSAVDTTLLETEVSNVWGARVERITFLGSVLELSCRLDSGLSVEVHVPSHMAPGGLEVGSECRLSVAAQYVRALRLGSAPAANSQELFVGQLRGG